MLVNIGGGAVLRSREMVGAFNLQTIGDSSITKEFLDLAKTEGVSVDLTGGHPKSLILTAEKIYLTTVSISTIRKRMLMGGGLEDGD